MLGLSNSQVLVLVMSEEANESVFVKREVERAVSMGKPVFPIRIREVNPSQSLEFFVAGFQWIDAWKPPIEQYLDQLANSLQSVGYFESGKIFNEEQEVKDKSDSQPAMHNNFRNIPIALLIMTVIGLMGWFGYEIWQDKSQKFVISETTPSNINQNKENIKIQKENNTINELSPVQNIDASKSEKEEIQRAQKSHVEQTVGSEASIAHASSSHQKLFTEAMKILEGTSNRERYTIIKGFLESNSLPKQLSVDQMLALIGSSKYRYQAISKLVEYLPHPLTFENSMKIVDPAQEHERYNLIKLLDKYSRIPKRLSVDQMLALIGSSKYRYQAISKLVEYLPHPLTFENSMKIVKPAQGSERYNLLKLLVSSKHMPSDLTSDQVVALIESSKYRQKAIEMLHN
jgi:hypothetical protein